MRFWPFGKDSDVSEISNIRNEHSGAVENELAPVISNEELDLDLFAHKSFNDCTVGDTAFLDAMIPAAGAVADAAAQYNHAVVRFPEGATWADLINRKTPGWEGFKQLGILKGGKFQPQAAIKQAKVQPAALGNLTLQGAAMVVGQMYMVEINKQLEEVTIGIASIQEEMRLERESNIEACMELLKEYSEDYMTIADDPTEHQAVRNQIEAIRKEAKEAWLFQMKQLQAIRKSLQKSGKLKDENLKAKILEFSQRDRAAHDSFIFLMAAEQVKMQYSQGYTEAQIAKERRSVSDRLISYMELRDGIQAQLINKIEKMPGKLLAIPSAGDTQEAAEGPVQRIGNAISNNIPRFFVPNMREEAKRQKEEKRLNYKSYVKRSSSIEDAANTRLANLDDLDFIYNRADALLIDESGIHYFCESDQIDFQKEN